MSAKMEKKYVETKISGSQISQVTHHRRTDDQSSLAQVEKFHPSEPIGLVPADIAY
jgi:hypothetical protein